jgi:ABC-2 type transport system ATP-binding protein
MAEAAIAVQDLVKRFGSVEAVRGISFEVPRGTIFGLLGRNGAGKTTTLETCIGLTAPTSGTVSVLGLDPARRRDFERLRQLIGVQLQATSLPEKARVREILDLYAVYYAIAPKTRELAERVGLEDKLERFVGKLSGGEQQRLALAIALLHDPQILFLDEPTAGMDTFGRRILWAEVERLRNSGKTLVLTTHYIEEAERLCDEICIVQAGRIVARDAPAALVAAYGGNARIDFVAKDFTPDAALEGLGRWSQPAGRWSLAVRGEPGQALGAIVTRANALGLTIEALDFRRPGLEDAFIAITGEALDEPGPAQSGSAASEYLESGRNAA